MVHGAYLVVWLVWLVVTWWFMLVTWWFGWWFIDGTMVEHKEMVHGGKWLIFVVESPA